MKTPLIALVVLASAAVAASPNGGRFDEQPVFTSGQAGYHTYRIPAIVRATNGSLLAFAEGRVNNRRDHDDVDLVLKRSFDDGATWSALQVVWGRDDGGVITWGNPCPVVDRSNGRVWLICCWENYEVYALFSDDHGATWSPPRNLTAQVWNPAWPRPPEPALTCWTGPGIGIQLERGPHAGRLVIPMHLQQHGKALGGREVTAFRSDDHGATWQYGANTNGTGNEAQIVELTDGRLAMNQRNRDREANPRYRLMSYSGDGGRSWSPSRPDAHLVGPQVQGSLLRYSWGSGGKSDRGVLLFALPAGPERERMTVHASLDDGETWAASRLANEEYSAYSSLVRQADDRVGLLYETDHYQFIRYARFDLGWLIANPGAASSATARPDKTAIPSRK